MFKRLRLRLALLCTIGTGIILLGMAGASLLYAQKQLQERGEAAFTGSVNAILYHIQGQDVLNHTWFSQTEASGDLLLYIEAQGQPLLYGQREDGKHRKELMRQAQEAALEEHGFTLRLPPESRLQADQVRFTFKDEQGQQYYAAAANVTQKEGWTGVLVVKSMRAEQEELAMQRWAFIGLAILSAVLLSLFAWIFTGRAIRPVEESRRRQAAFVSAASHELRSPLAVIQASLSAMQTAPPDRAKRFAESASSECARMARLVGDLLLLARADNGSWSVRCEETEPETLLLDACESFEPVAAAHGLRLRAELPESPLPKCDCDPERIIQVLSILLDNAISYTPAGGTIRLSVQAVRGGVHLMVEDSGPGIPDAEKERVFERFHRLEESRSRREHFGLGLCIAKEIVTAHRGRIWAEDVPGGGARISVFVPLHG